MFLSVEKTRLMLKQKDGFEVVVLYWSDDSILRLGHDSGKRNIVLHFLPQLCFPFQGEIQKSVVKKRFISRGWTCIGRSLFIILAGIFYVSEKKKNCLQCSSGNGHLKRAWWWVIDKFRVRKATRMIERRERWETMSTPFSSSFPNIARTRLGRRPSLPLVRSEYSYSNSNQRIHVLTITLEVSSRLVLTQN